MKGETCYSLLVIEIVLAISSSLASDSLAVCDKSFDIDLRNHKAFINYATNNDTAVENAFDRNNKTIVCTYFALSADVIPAQYLDKGYNWVMVELNKNKFEIVESITLVLRQDQTSPSLKRLSDIEVLISSKMDREPTLFVANKAGEISWDYFVGCGTTGSARGDTTVDCQQHLMNSNFVAVRRNRETGPCSSFNAYCGFDFAELKVNLLVQLDHPKISETPWKENYVAYISSTTSEDCALPRNLQLQWSLNMFNGSKIRFPVSSTTLTIQSLNKQNSGSYFYEILLSNGGQIFQSNNTKNLIVSYKSRIRNNNSDEYYYENNTTELSCSVSGGYPHPKLLTAQFMSISNNTAHIKNDSFYGKEAESSIQIVMNRSMNFQNFTCTLQQPNFSTTTKIIPIIVYYSAGPLIASNTSTQLNESDLFELSCSTSDFGFPAPTIVITIGKNNVTTSYGRVQDNYRGESVIANFSAPVVKAWNNEEVTCTLIQQGFPQQSWSLTLQITDSTRCDTICIVIIVASLLAVLVVVAVIILLVKRCIEIRRRAKKKIVKMPKVQLHELKKDDPQKYNNSKQTTDGDEDLEYVYENCIDRVSNHTSSTVNENQDHDAEEYYNGI